MRLPFQNTINKINEAAGLPMVRQIPNDIMMKELGINATFPETQFTQTQKMLGIYPVEDSEQYLKVFGVMAPVYRAVTSISQSIAQLPIVIKQYKDITNPDTFEDVSFKYPELIVFQKPNIYMPKFVFIEQVYGYLEIVGELFLLKDFDNTGKVIGLLPLNPTKIKINPDSETFVRSYTYELGEGKTIEIPEECILYMKYFNPTNPLRGLSPITAARNEVILDLNAVEATKTYFKQGSQPSGIMTTAEKFSKSEGDRVKAWIDDQTTGVKNFNKILYLSHGYTWKQMQINNKDMQYMEQREWNQSTISQVFGVPPIIQMDFKDASVLSNADIQWHLFWTNMLPKMQRVSELFTMFLLPEVSDQKNLLMEFDTSKVVALKPDEKAMTEKYKTGINYGAVTPNEMRVDVFGKERVNDPVMDMHFLPTQLIPIAAQVAGVEESEGKTDLMLQVADIAKRIDGISWEVVVEKNGGGEIGQIKAHHAEALDLIQKQADLAYIHKTTASLTKITRKLVRKFTPVLVKLFKQQEKEVLDNVYADKFYKFTIAGSTINYAKWVKIFAKAGKPFIAEGMKLAGDDLANDFNYEFDSQDPSATKFVNKQSISYAKLVNDTTKKDIDRILAGAIDDALSIDDTAKLLSGYFSSQGRMRALRIARTEMVRATNGGRDLSAKLSEILKWKTWITQRDGDVRDGHALLDGDTVKVDEPFQVSAGYSGDAHYPSDINERCYIIYSRKKKKWMIN